MPFDDGLGLNQDQCFFPSRKETAEYQPEEPVSGFKPRLGHRALKDRELMAQSEVFEQELGLRLAGREQDTEDRQDEGEHGLISMVPPAQNSRPINDYRVFATDRVICGGRK